MAKSRLRSNRRLPSRRIKPPKWSKEKKIGMTIIGVICGILALLVAIGAFIKYYRLISK